MKYKIVFGTIFLICLSSTIAYNYLPIFKEDCTSMSEWSTIGWSATLGKCKATYGLFLYYRAYSPYYDTRNATSVNVTFTYLIGAGRRSSTTMILKEHKGDLTYNFIWSRICPPFAGSCSGTKELVVNYYNITNTRFFIECLMTESGQYCQFDDFLIEGWEDTGEFKSTYNPWIVNCSDVTEINNDYNVSSVDIYFEESGGVYINSIIREWTSINILNTCEVYINQSGSI